MVLGAAGIVRLLSEYQARYRSLKPYSELIETKWFVAYLVFAVGSALLLGLPSPHMSVQRASGLALASVFATTLLFAAVTLLFGPWLLPRPVILGAPLLLGPWYIACTMISKIGWKNRKARERVLLIGSETDSAKLQSELLRHTRLPASLVCSSAPADLTAAGSLESMVDAERVTLIVLSEEAQRSDDLVQQVSLKHRQGVRVRSLRGFYEGWLGKLPTSELVPMNLMLDVGEIHRSVFQRTKRILDIFCALVGLPIVAAVIPIVRLGNSFSNKGPLFFAQERVGLNGRVFRIFKFRSMIVEASTQNPANAGVWTQPGDIRITSFGGFLRRTHLDEIPQFWNLLRGDISLVGPRPEQVHYVESLTERLDHYDVRHSVRPGLTGWAQVCYPYGATEDDASEKLEYELFYLANQSLLLDATIIARTVAHVFLRGGR